MESRIVRTKKLSEQHKKNVSRAAKGKKKYWLQGRHLSEEHKKKLSENFKAACQELWDIQ